MPIIRAVVTADISLSILANSDAQPEHQKYDSPEFNPRGESLFKTLLGTLINAEKRRFLPLISVNQRSSASNIKFGVNHFSFGLSSTVHGRATTRLHVLQFYPSLSP